MVALHLLLYRTRVGTALRALASNPDLAVSRGIPGERMISLMWFVSGAYAALGGTLFAFETRLQPDMDLIILLPTFAAVTIGGLDNVFGAVAGALILSLAQNLLISVDFGSLFSDRLLVRADAVPRLHRGRRPGRHPAAPAARHGRPATR